MPIKGSFHNIMNKEDQDALTAASQKHNEEKNLKFHSVFGSDCGYFPVLSLQPRPCRNDFPKQHRCPGQLFV